jgi:DNA-binding transcriptional MerR regulator
VNEEASHLPIGQVARLAGVHVQTVRYYERRGLIEPPALCPSGQRAYAPDVVSLLRAVKTAQRLGFTLSELLRLSNGRARGGARLQARMRERVIEIDGKIADLYAMRERLADVLHAGCDSLTNCTCPSCPLLIDHRGRGNLTFPRRLIALRASLWNSVRGRAHRCCMSGVLPASDRRRTSGAGRLTGNLVPRGCGGHAMAGRWRRDRRGRAGHGSVALADEP